jgi:hypothetical protein
LEWLQIHFEMEMDNAGGEMKVAQMVELDLVRVDG